MFIIMYMYYPYRSIVSRLSLKTTIFLLLFFFFNLSCVFRSAQGRLYVGNTTGIASSRYECGMYKRVSVALQAGDRGDFEKQNTEVSKR